MGETNETLMHVASMLHFTLPPDAGPEYLPDLVAALRASPIEPPWNLRLQTRMLMRQPVHRWVTDREFDIDYHVRHSALPSPGGERELGVLVSRLHSNPLDFRRPPWELHLIEGLSGNRFAAYIKIHHSLVDGYTGMRLLVRGLSTDPDDREHPFFFSLTRRPRAPRETDPVGDFASILRGLLIGRHHAVGGQALAETQLRPRPHVDARGDVVPGAALDPQRAGGPVPPVRHAAVRLRRLRAIARARGATVNDVLMAICAGGLRRFLMDLQKLPERPLIAFVPVNVRPKESEGGGNAVGATLVSLATDIDDPLARLAAITASARAAKARMRGMSADAVMAYSALLLAPAALQVTRAMSGLPLPLPTTLNVCISNVPGPKEALYWRGARLEATYPVSIPGTRWPSTSPRTRMPVTSTSASSATGRRCRTSSASPCTPARRWTSSRPRWRRWPERRPEVSPRRRRCRC